MKIRPLAIGVNELRQIEALRERASASPIEMSGLLERLKDPAEKRRHMEQMSGQTIELPIGYVVTLSIETSHPAGTARHISVSVDDPDPAVCPGISAVCMIAQELGFSGFSITADPRAFAEMVLAAGCHFYLERLAGHGQAINLIQPIDITGEAGRA